MTINVPNLDCMDADDLMAFWNKHRGGRSHREIFPEGDKGTKSVVADLANYASNKATAVQLRLAGKIAAAQQYEAICERIYDGLGKFG